MCTPNIQPFWPRLPLPPPRFSPVDRNVLAGGLSKFDWDDWYGQWKSGKLRYWNWEEYDFEVCWVEFGWNDIVGEERQKYLFKYLRKDLHGLHSAYKHYLDLFEQEPCDERRKLWKDKCNRRGLAFYLRRNQAYNDNPLQFPTIAYHFALTHYQSEMDRYSERYPHAQERSYIVKRRRTCQKYGLPFVSSTIQEEKNRTTYKRYLCEERDKKRKEEEEDQLLLQEYEPLFDVAEKERIRDYMKAKEADQDLHLNVFSTADM